MGLAEGRSLKVSPHEVRSLEVGFGEVRFLQMSSEKERSLEVRLAEGRSFQMGPIEVCSLEVGLVQVRSSKVRITKIKALNLSIPEPLRATSQNCKYRLNINRRLRFLPRVARSKVFPDMGRLAPSGVFPDIGRQNFHNRPVIRFRRISRDPLQSIDAAEPDFYCLRVVDLVDSSGKPLRDLTLAILFKFAAASFYVLL